MHNIEYLTERDLKYFEKKEALGEAIIIRIEPEALLSLDLDALFQDRKKDQMLSAEELEEFLHISPKQTEEMGESTSHSGDANENGIERNLQSVHLSAEHREILG